MEINKVKELINKKIDEHRMEMNGSNNLQGKIQSKLETLKNNKTIPMEDKIKTAQELLIIKEKLVFHKACIAVLNDLLEDINNEGRQG